MQSESFDRFSHHGLSGISCSTNIVSVRVILGGVLTFIFSLVFYILGARACWI